MHFKVSTAVSNVTGKPKRKKRSKSKAGILYILVFRLKCGLEVVKIGITTRSIEERMAEVLISFFLQYRYVPECTPKRFTRLEDVADKEKQMHKEFSEYSYEFDKKFSGFSEFFTGVELDTLVDYYDTNYKGKPIEAK